MSLVLLASTLLGCSVHEVDEDPTPLVGISDAYGAQGIPSTQPEDDRTPPEEAWWKTFGDDALDALVRQALESNLELERAAARVAVAAAVLRRTGARLFPTLDFGAGYETSWTERLDGSDDEGHEEGAQIGLLFEWELDAWGRVRAERRAAELDAEATRDELDLARLLLSAAVVETYFQVLEQRLQLELIDSQVRTNETLLELTRLRFGQGQSSVVDVLQQREQLASTLALVPVARSRLEELELALDTLLGVPVGERARVTTDAFPALPEWPRLGMPADLSSARPDLRSTRRRLIAADHRVGAAIADRFPRLRIGASVTAAGDLRPETLLLSALGELVAPVLDGGARVAAVEEQRAELREAVADWSQAYLAAVEDVEAALALERGQVERVRLQEEQLAIARELLRETRNRYSQGLTDYLPVLAALATQQRLERDLIAGRRASLSLRATLHRALGGPMPPLGSTGDAPRATLARSNSPEPDDR